MTGNHITSYVPVSPPPEDELQQQLRKFVTKSPSPDEAFYFQRCSNVSVSCKVKPVGYLEQYICNFPKCGLAA